MRHVWKRWILLAATLAASITTADLSRAQVSPGSRRIVNPPQVAAIAPGMPVAVVVPAPSVTFPAGQNSASGFGIGAGCSVNGSSQPAPLVTLVSALKCDPDLIFEYVYNNIEFEPLYGSNKGPLGALLDGRGDDADQVMLLITLFNIAGYTQTGYINLLASVNGPDMANWLGVKNDANAIQNVLIAGGIPFTAAVANSDGTLASIKILHFWAALQLSGTWYVFDPSFKRHTILTGLSSSALASALGYNRAQFLADAGGTIDGISISNINRSKLRADLAGYASNLVNYINQNNRTWRVGDVISGRLIQPALGLPIRQTMPSVTPTPAFPATCPNQTTTPECRMFITIQMPGASSGQAIKLYTDQVYGHRITVSSQPSGSNFIPTLLIDGAVPACVAAGTCTNVGPAVAAGTVWQIPVQVFEPNQSANPACTSGIAACDTLKITAAAGASYLIGLGAGQVGRGMVDYHRQLLAQARATGNADTSELVLGENLAVINYGWLAEVSAEQTISARLAQTTTTYNFALGITGQANIQQTGFAGPYVDLPINFSFTNGQNSNSPTITIAGNVYPLPFIVGTFADSMTSSSFESAILEQTQAPVAQMTAASTMKIIDSNMDPAFPGALQRTFFADGTTAAGRSTYTSNILPLINTNYNSPDLTAISNSVAAGNQVLIPQNGKLAVGHWIGGGYSAILPLVQEIDFAQRITGGMSGGFTGADDPNPAPNTQSTMPAAANSDTSPSIINSIPAPANPQIAEPVDGISGAYVYTNRDLLTGSGNFPYALAFARTYLSSTGTARTTTSGDTGLGNGWSHNWSSKVQTQSDPYLGIGTDSSPAVSAATSIAAIYVMLDLMSVAPSAQNWTISSMVARWFTDQLTGNAAIVTQPDTTEEFIALPHADGSTSIAFNPPPGSSARLNQIAAGQFSYMRKNGVVSNYGPSPAGALQSIVYPNGVTVSLTYSGSPLTLSRIGNNLQRSLSLAYTGSHVASVTDDSGRRVTYGYDGNNNLTAVTDTLGAVARFSYDTTGAFDTSGHLTQIFYPAVPGTAFVSNWYDSLGRVAAQANASGNVTTFYFAGSRTETVDPLQNRHVTYQTDRGRVLSDAYVLSSSFGDVFNDTAQQNGVINVTNNVFDGLDRLTKTTLPARGSVAYTYASVVNPWANNLASRTVNSQSVFDPSLTTTYSYDPVFNKPVSVTDPLGLVTTMSYDGFGNLTRSVADFGASPHFNARTAFTYNNVGQIVAATDPLGTVTQFSYDGAGNLLSVTRDAGTGRLNQLTSFAYNAPGDVVSSTDPAGNVTTNTYDAARRLLSTTAPNGLLTSFTYDANGQLLATQQSQNGTALRNTSTTYSVTGKPAATTDANNNTTTFSYDALDRVARVTDSMGRVTNYGYDPLSRQISISNPAIQVTPLLQKAYTPDGMLASLTDANNNTTTFSYDGFDRLRQTIYASISSENFGYDADSNVVTHVTRSSTSINYGYDTLNRLATKTPPSPEPTVTYSYDLAGRLTGVSDTSAAVVAAAPPGGTPVQYAAAYSYDVMNRPTGASWSPAPAAAAPTASSVSFGHSYNGVNQRIGQTISDNSWVNYPAATPGTTSYTTNTLNQYLKVGSPISFTYDSAGNLRFDGSATFLYDSENRLTSASTGSVSNTYAYDAQGRRKSKNLNGVKTAFVTDADNREVLEYDGTSGAIQRWYAYALGPNDVLNQMNVTSGTRATLVPDIIGSIIGSQDSSSGVLTKVGYLPYGKSASAGPFGFTGQRIDPEIGAIDPIGNLYYYRARHYSPAWGRFLQPDPIGYAGGANLYAYVGNDPLNATDLTGLWSPVAHDVILQYAFGGRLSVTDIQALQQSSRAFDSNNQGFGATSAPLHSMRAVGQSADAAIVARDTFVQQTEVQAQQLNQVGNTNGALTLLGQALHPIMDASSPEHTTPNGLPRLWAPWTMYGHSLNESFGHETATDLTPAILDQQRAALNEAYDKVFGYSDQMSSGSARPGTPGK